MTATFDVLIIEDHELISNAYIKALHDEFITNKELAFNIDTAFDCMSAINKLDKNNYDLIFLDISLPSTDPIIRSGQDLGIYIRKKMPKAKILIATSHNSIDMIYSLLKLINPEGLLIKGELRFKELVVAIHNVMYSPPYYTKTVSQYLQNYIFNEHTLDKIDRQILYELSIGTKMNEMPQYISLPRSTLEKRILKLMSYFKVNSSKELILKAKEKGFI